VRAYPRYRVELELTRELVGRHYLVQFVPVDGVDYFPIKLTWESFRLGASDYDVNVDEQYCPCGASLDVEWPPFLGEIVEGAQEHIEQAHPEVLR
jgi:hypothetical protein